MEIADIGIVSYKYTPFVFYQSIINYTSIYQNCTNERE